MSNIRIFADYYISRRSKAKPIDIYRAFASVDDGGGLQQRDTDPQACTDPS